MRIIHWAHSLLNENGGLEEFVLSLAFGLASENREVAIVTESSNSGGVVGIDRFDSRIPLHQLDLRSHVEGSDGSAALAGTRRQLDDFLDQFRPDLIHLHSVSRGDIALLISVVKRRRIPLVYTLHAPLDSPGHRRYLEPLLPHIVKIIAPSHYMLKCFEDAFPSARPVAVTIMNRVEDYYDIKPELKPQQIYASGRHVSDKGFSTLIAALPVIATRIPNVELVLAGTGPDSLSLQKLASIFGVAERITWPGWIPREEGRQIVASSGVACVPSTWDEPFGLVAAEALMAGTPVVASQKGGLPEMVIPDQTGYLVPPGDVTRLALTLSEILINSDLRQRLGSHARAFARQRLALSENISAHLSLYEQVIKNSNEA